MRRWFFIFVFGVSIFAAGIFWHERRLNSPQIIHNSTLLSPDFFDTAYRQAPSFTREKNIPAAAIIVSHHLLVAPLIAATFETTKAQRPKTVFIIGPDHLRRGKTPATVSLGFWRTPYGMIAPNESAIKALTTIKGVMLDEAPFDYEHSIAALVPFVKRSLPNAKIVPIMLREDASLATIRQIFEALPAGDETLLVFSVDFSHYLPASIARFHDTTSVSVLRSATFKDVDKLEIDSIPSLQLLQLYVERRGAQHVELLKRTDGTEAAGVPSTEGITSYIFARYTGGLPNQDQVVTYAAIGSKQFPSSPEDRLARGFDLSDQTPDGTYEVRGATVTLLTNPASQQVAEAAKTAAHTIVRGRNPAPKGTITIGPGRVTYGEQVWVLPVGLMMSPQALTGFDMRLNQGTLPSN